MVGGVIRGQFVKVVEGKPHVEQRLQLAMLNLAGF